MTDEKNQQQEQDQAETPFPECMCRMMAGCCQGMMDKMKGAFAAKSKDGEDTEASCC